MTHRPESSDLIPPAVDSSPALNPATTRRHLLKRAALVAPAILTLRSGAALARVSGCYAIANATATNPETVPECAVTHKPPVCASGSGTDCCESYCLDGYSVPGGCTTYAENNTDCQEFAPTTYFCKQGALVSATAYASLGPNGNWGASCE